MAAGQDKFYRLLLSYALSKMILINQGFDKGITPDIAFLDFHDQFLILYRREGDQHHLNMARAFRKAAHKIHRVFLKNNIVQQNNKFLYLIQS